MSESWMTILTAGIMAGGGILCFILGKVLSKGVVQKALKLIAALADALVDGKLSPEEAKVLANAVAALAKKD